MLQVNLTFVLVDTTGALVITFAVPSLMLWGLIRLFYVAVPRTSRRKSIVLPPDTHPRHAGAYLYVRAGRLVLFHLPRRFPPALVQAQPRAPGLRTEATSFCYGGVRFSLTTTYELDWSLGVCQLSSFVSRNLSTTA
jgi:hypothetical protein